MIQHFTKKIIKFVLKLSKKYNKGIFPLGLLNFFDAT